jgi:hypothetical protein
MRCLVEEAYIDVRNGFQAHERAHLIPSLFDGRGQRRPEEEIAWEPAVDEIGKIADPRNSRRLPKHIDVARRLLAELRANDTLSTEEEEALAAFQN